MRGPDRGPGGTRLKLPAKLSRPRNARGFARERLFSLLDRASPIAWISAPAGAGKTTLAASYVDERDLGCLWYLLDEGDADAASFFHYLKLAATPAAGRRRMPLPSFGPEYLQSIALFARRFLEALCKGLRRPCVLVFDDYHALPAASPIHSALAAGLAALSDGMRAIIISRTAPPQDFARLQANGALAVLGWENLRFTLEETGNLMRSRVRADPGPQAARSLHEITDGWVAGMVLMLGRHGSDPLSAQPLGGAARGQVFDYFASELFSRLDADTRALLLKTSFLSHVQPEIADALCGYLDADRLLADLCREHLFTVRSDSARASYRYHPLLREYLMQRARRDLGEAQFVALQARAAALLEERGQIEAAAELFAGAGDWQDLARVICKHAGGLLGQGRGEIVRGWIAALPRSLAETPWLSYWQGACNLALDPAGSRRLFERAFAQFRAAGERTGMLQSWAAAAGAVLHEMDYRLASDWVATLDEVLAENASYPSAALERQVAMSCFNILALGTPEHPAVPALRERAYAFIFEADAAADPNLFLMTACYLATHLMWRGEFRRATLVIDTLKPLARALAATDLVRIVAKSMEALGAVFTAEPDVSLESARAALRIAEESGVHVWDTHLLGHGLAGALAKGDKTATAEFLPRMAESIREARGIDRGYYHLLVSWKAMLEDDDALALRHLELIAENVASVRYPPVEAAARAYRAEMLFRTGKPQAVDALLAEASDIARRIDSPVTLFHCLIAKAAIAFEGAAPAEGPAALREAFAIGRRHGIYGCHWWRPSLMASLAAKALAAGIEVEYVRGLVRRRGLAPPASPAALPEWPWPLRIRALGGLEIERDGETLHFERKAPQKPLALLKLLIVCGAGGARVSELSDALWPQAEGDSAHDAFKTTLQRLRKLVGERCLPLREGRVVLDPRCCWVDAWAFEQRLPAGSDALQLYRGDLLAGLADDGLEARIEPCRRRLRQQFERAGAGRRSAGRN